MFFSLQQLLPAFCNLLFSHVEFVSLHALVAVRGVHAEVHPQAAHILVRLLPQTLHLVVLRQTGAGGVDPFGQGVYGGGVKIDIGDGGEQALHQQQSLFRGRGAALTDELPGIGNERSGQPVLRVGRLGGLAADSGCTGARGAVRGLLALKTKHGIVHIILPFQQKIPGVWAKKEKLNKKSRAPVNCTPFVRQYGILFKKWGVFVCRKRKSKRHIVENSK